MSSSKYSFAPEVEKAFTALASYMAGSSRGALLPIDHAVSASSGDARARLELERRLVETLKVCASEPAQEYICNRLAMVGGEKSVPALAALLGSAHVGTAARTALEANPSTAATKALRASLKELTGLQKAGAITSLGVRHDQSSVKMLAALLKPHGEPASYRVVAEAAAGALGEIGTQQALGALQSALRQVPSTLLPAVKDALKACEERVKGHW